MGGKRKSASELNFLPRLVFGVVPFKHLAGRPLHREPTHESAAAYVVAAIVPLSVQTEDVESLRLRFWNDEVTE